MYVRINRSDPDGLELAAKITIKDTNEKQENGHANHSEDKNQEAEAIKAIDDVNTAETQLERIPYPKSVFFIISNEFCERFSYYGMRTILSLYLRDILLYSESDSTVIFHAFTMFAYFFPLLGGILSDSWLGKYRTIMYVSMIYAAGNVLLALSAATDLNIPQAPFSLLALFLIALGTGGIKPCVSSFGGDQFVVPQQEKQLVAFFSVFYFSINAGSLISTFLTPVLRKNVECFGEDTCYPLAFGVPGALMIVAIVVFFLGTPMYKIKMPEGNVTVNVVKCMWYAMKKKFRSEDSVDHWLDRAQKKYDSRLVDDIKVTLKVLVIMIPVPVFWALFDQQGSGWTFQATRMDGRLGSWTILPDQMQVINPLLILLFIPLFTYVIYPFLARYNLLTKALHRMACGGFLAAIAFGISAGVSFALEATYPHLPTDGTCQLRIYNPQGCEAAWNVPDLNISKMVPSMGYEYINYEQIKGQQNVSYTLTATCVNGIENNTKGILALDQRKGFFLYPSVAGFLYDEDDISKPEDGLPLVRTLVGNAKEVFNLTYKHGGRDTLNLPSTNYSLFTFQPGTYLLSNFSVEFNLGGVYTVLVTLDGDQIGNVTTYEVTQHNSIHMLWVIPQYFIITAAEILFSITGLEFSYSQAPVSMKSIVSAMWLLTSAFGNLIIVIIESAKTFDKQSYDFLLYTGLMVVDMVIFAWIASRYKYVRVAVDKDEQESEEPKKNGIKAD